MSDSIIGRDRERSEVASSLDDPSGASLVVIRGAAGVGKTTLLHTVVADSTRRGRRVLRATGVETEASYAFAHLADLLGETIDDHLEHLPPPQRRALEFALLRADPEGLSPDQRAVAAATVSVLQRMASLDDEPILLVVDDLQWVDLSTLAVLGFVLRRVADDPIRMVAASRTGPSDDRPVDPFAGIRSESLELQGLDVHRLGQLLSSELELILSRSHLMQLHAATRGNPFFALEWGRSLASEVLPPTDRPLPVPSGVQSLVAGRLDRLPADAAGLLLAVALLSVPTTRELEKVTATLGVSTTAIDLAVDAAVLDRVGGTIRFRHPLMRSVVVERADPDEVRGLHRVLAGVVSNDEEQARHLALSCEGPDAVVADIVDAAAADARGRGAPESAAELGQLAVALTPDFVFEIRHGRVLATADHLFAAGDTMAAAEMLGGWRDQCPPGVLQAETLLALGLVHHRGESFALAADAYRAGLAQPGLTPGLASDLHRELAYAQLFQGHPTEAAEHVDACLALARRDGNGVRVLSARLVEGAVRFITGGGTAEGLREEVLNCPSPTSSR